MFPEDAKLWKALTRAIESERAALMLLGNEKASRALYTYWRMSGVPSVVRIAEATFNSSMTEAEAVRHAFASEIVVLEEWFNTTAAQAVREFIGNTSDQSLIRFYHKFMEGMK